MTRPSAFSARVRREARLRLPAYFINAPPRDMWPASATDHARPMFRKSDHGAITKRRRT